MTDRPEPLQTERMRYAATPVKYPVLAEMLEKAQDGFWVRREILPDLMRDKKTFDSLSPQMKRLLEHVLGFFAVSDGVVNEMIGDYLKADVKAREYLDLLSQQEAIEVVHGQCYSVLVDTYFGPERAAQIKDAMATFPSVAAKVAFIRDAIMAEQVDEVHSRFAMQIFMSAIMEGLFFSGSFCVIFWIIHSGIRMPGLAKANEFISRDEGMHAETSIEVYRNHIAHKLTQTRAHAVMRDAIAIEHDFVAAALPSGMAGMNAELMMQYLQFVADQLLVKLGYEKLFLTTNPFGFMTKQSVSVRSTDFFTSAVTEYNPAPVEGLSYD